MRTRTLSIILLTALAFSSCQKQIDEPNQSPTEENASRRGGPNKNPPVANAGVDITTFLPAGPIFLNGRASDPDYNITSVLWTKISGPSSFSIDNANAVRTYVRNLVQGVYQFELKVTDKTRLVDRDTVQVWVNALSTQPPPCTSCKIVFVSSRDGNDEIYSCNADGSNLTRLTNDPGYDGQPAWSPDNTKIAFISDRSGTPELYIMNADGLNVVQRTFSGSDSQYPTWSPDGTKIAFSSFGFETGDYDIFVIDAAGGSPSLLYGGWGYDNYPAWSPDGTKIAFTCTTFGRFDEVLGIGTINSDGTGFTLLAGVENAWFLHPDWSPNGSMLSFVNGNYVGVMNWDGSGATHVGFGGIVSRTSWSADGTTIAFTLGGDVLWVSADGSVAGRIITNGWDADWQH